MQYHRVHKSTILVPHLGFLKQQKLKREVARLVGKLWRQNFRSGTAHFGLFPAVLFGALSMGFPVTAGILHRECVGWGSQLQCWYPQGLASPQGSGALLLLLLPSCWQPCLFVFSALGLCSHFLLLVPPSVFSLWKKDCFSTEKWI